MNSFFLDASALAKRYVAEPGTPLLDSLLDSHEIIHAPTLRKVEATNALVVAALSHIEDHSINATDAIVLHATLALAQHFRARGDDLVMHPPKSVKLPLVGRDSPAASYPPSIPC